MIKTFRATFTESKYLIPDVATFSFNLPPQESLTFAPGQYMIMHVPRHNSAPGSAPEDDARRIFSLVNDPHESKSFTLLAKIIPGGVASEYFKSLQTRQEVLFQGSAGVFVLKPTDHDRLMVATGTGIAPILSMLRAGLVDYPKSRFTLLWGLKSGLDTYLLEELKELATRHPNFDFLICLSRQKEIQEPAGDQSHFAFGYVSAPMEEYIRQAQSVGKRVDYYISGGRDIVESLRQRVLAERVAPQDISFEKFV